MCVFIWRYLALHCSIWINESNNDRLCTFTQFALQSPNRSPQKKIHFSPCKENISPNSPTCTSPVRKINQRNDVLSSPQRPSPRGRTIFISPNVRTIDSTEYSFLPSSSIIEPQCLPKPILKKTPEKSRPATISSPKKYPSTPKLNENLLPETIYLHSLAQKSCSNHIHQDKDVCDSKPIACASVAFLVGIISTFLMISIAQ